MTIRLSAFPVRMSYNVKVRSEPILARTDDSAMLKRTDVIVSVEVGNVRFETGALLKKEEFVNIYAREIRELQEKVLCFIPYLYCIGSCGKKRVCTMVVYGAGKEIRMLIVQGEIWYTYLKAAFPGKTFSG